MSAQQINNRQQIVKFRYSVLIFFICLTLPFAMIVYFGFQKFENEKLLEYQLGASEVLVNVNNTLSRRLKTEQTRPPNDYYYFKTPLDDISANNVSGSEVTALARLREPHYLYDQHGLIGYFNLNRRTELNIPSLPYSTLKLNLKAELRINKNKVEEQLELKRVIKDILLSSKIMVEEDSTDIEKDRLIDINKSPVFQLLETKNNQIIIYRSVELEGQSLLQGFIVNKQEYVINLIGSYIRRTGFDHQMQIQLKDKFVLDFQQYQHYKIDSQGKKTTRLISESKVALTQVHIFHGDLIAPFNHLTLIFSTDFLPLGAASEFVVFFVILLSVVIIGGCFGFYWLGMKQIALAEQRMNFVSSVSHELKTPLTSILMYSEMLKSEMIDEKAVQLEYYNFIYFESERLSRLINNVLKLSNLSQKSESVNLEYTSVATLKDIIQSKVATLISTNDFQLNFKNADSLNDFKALVDLDAFSQIMINLIDNSVKFYNAANIKDVNRQIIDISFLLAENPKDTLQISVRDYGPGISSAQHEKIFELFYRCGNELTRTTYGTGIGLALVRELLLAQDADIKVLRHDQGVAFKLTFKMQK